jgi:hypothetical protein
LPGRRDEPVSVFLSLQKFLDGALDERGVPGAAEIPVHAGGANGAFDFVAVRHGHGQQRHRHGASTHEPYQFEIVAEQRGHLNNRHAGAASKNLVIARQGGRGAPHRPSVADSDPQQVGRGARFDREYQNG